MKKEIYQKLIENVLMDLNERYGDDGCTDLYDDDPLLKGLSKKELLKINKEWVEKFPVEAKEHDAREMLFSSHLIDLLLKLINENKKKYKKHRK